MKELLLLSCWILVLVSGSEDRPVNITAVEGENTTLPCKVDNNSKIIKIIVVKWTRPELEKDQFVFFYRDDQIDPDNHPSYKNRVNLKDREMKNGDVSLILNNVTFNDSGTFNCSVVQRRNNKNIKSTSLISLSVVPPGEPEEERRKEERVMEERVKEEREKEERVKEEREKEEREKEEGGGLRHDALIGAVIGGLIGAVIGVVVVVKCCPPRLCRLCRQSRLCRLCRPADQDQQDDRVQGPAQQIEMEPLNRQAAPGGGLEGSGEPPGTASTPQ